jgi:hypothetical protein
MEVIYAHEHPCLAPKHSMFLAGPSPRGSADCNWRPEALEYLSITHFDGTVYVPLPRNGEWLPEYDHEAQASWELQYLEQATVVVFWVPRHVHTLPGFTTNVEFGLYVSSGKIVLGYPESAHKMRYLRFLANKFNVSVWHTLPQTLNGALRLLTRKSRRAA